MNSIITISIYLWHVYVENNSENPGQISLELDKQTQQTGKRFALGFLCCFSHKHVIKKLIL